jgi:hypothetical protein
MHNAAQDGTAVYALDTDPAMLDQLRQKLTHHPPEVRERVVVVVGDMRTFTLAERFPLIIAPFRGFLHNLTEQDQLARVHRRGQTRSNRSRFMTLSHAATKSRANFSSESAHA